MWPLTSQALHNTLYRKPRWTSNRGKMLLLPVKDGSMWDSVILLVNPLKGAWQALYPLKPRVGKKGGEHLARGDRHRTRPWLVFGVVRVSTL